MIRAEWKWLSFQFQTLRQAAGDWDPGYTRYLWPRWPLPCPEPQLPFVKRGLGSLLDSKYSSQGCLEIGEGDIWLRHSLSGPRNAEHPAGPGRAPPGPRSLCSKTEPHAAWGPFWTPRRSTLTRIACGDMLPSSHSLRQPLRWGSHLPWSSKASHQVERVSLVTLMFKTSPFLTGKSLHSWSSDTYNWNYYVNQI